MAPEARRSFPDRRDQPAWSPSRDRRPPRSGSAVMRIRDVSGERLNWPSCATTAQARGALGRLRRALETAGMPAGRGTPRAGSPGAILRTRRRSMQPQDEGGDRKGRRTVRPGGAPRSGGVDQGDGRLEAPRVGGRRGRASNLRGRRGAHGGRLRRRRPRCFRDRGASGGYGAQRRRLFADDRSAVDRGRDLRPLQAADLVQRRLPADLVARAGLPRSRADRR